MPKDKTRLTVTAAIACVFASNCALLHAQADSDTGPAAIIHGPLSLLPLLSIEAAYDDNIFESTDNEVDSWVTRVNPSVITAIETGGQAYTLAYHGAYGRYHDSEDDNYQDHDFNADADLKLGLRNHVKLGAAYTMGHEDRGTRLSEGFDPDNPSIDKPLEVDTTRINGSYAYGSNVSIGRIVLAANYRDLAYQNDRQRTRFRDYENTGASVTFYYNIMPATSLLFEVRGDEVSYKQEEPGRASFDSQTQHYLFGATWDVTELTSGTIKLGQVKREFDDQARGDFSGFDWELDMRWSPRSYSHIDVITAREEDEAYGDGNFIDVQRYEITWSHNWTDRFGTKISAAYRDESFEGINREEQSCDYGIALNYLWRRWFSVELGVDFSDRDSTLENLVFDRTVYSLAVNLSL